MEQDFYQLPDSLLERKLPATDFLVYMALVALNRRQEKCVTASVDSIARQANLHFCTVHAALKRLAEQQLLTIHANTVNGLHTSNTYLLLEDAPFTLIPTDIFQYKLPPSHFLMYCFLRKWSHDTNNAALTVVKAAQQLPFGVYATSSAVHSLVEKGLLGRLSEKGKESSAKYFLLR